MTHETAVPCHHSKHGASAELVSVALLDSELGSLCTKSRIEDFQSLRLRSCTQMDMQL